MICCKYIGSRREFDRAIQIIRGPAAAAGTLFTEEQLHSTVTRYAALPAQDFFDRVINNIRQFSERQSFDDDICVVAMEVQHKG